MGVRLIESNSKNFTTIGKLKDGQIAVVMGGQQCGEIVLRYGDNCVAIGKTFGHGWTSCESNTLTVRILENGELIEII
jgi:hypothetical protein